MPPDQRQSNGSGARLGRGLHGPLLGSDQPQLGDLRRGAETLGRTPVAGATADVHPQPSKPRKGRPAQARVSPRGGLASRRASKPVGASVANAISSSVNKVAPAAPDNEGTMRVPMYR